MKTTEDSLRDLWDNIKHTNIPSIGVPEEEEKKKGYEKIFEEITVEWKRKQLIKCKRLKESHTG